MKQNNKIKIGQTIYLRPIRNASRRSNEIRTGIVSKVGNKYFELKDWTNERFIIDKMQQDGKGFFPDWLCYLSMQDIQDEDEKKKLLEKLNKIFGNYGNCDLSLEQLRKINLIIEAPTLESLNKEITCPKYGKTCVIDENQCTDK